MEGRDRVRGQENGYGEVGEGAKREWLMHGYWLWTRAHGTTKIGAEIGNEGSRSAKQSETSLTENERKNGKES